MSLEEVLAHSMKAVRRLSEQLRAVLSRHLLFLEKGRREDTDVRNIVSFITKMSMNVATPSEKWPRRLFKITWRAQRVCKSLDIRRAANAVRQSQEKSFDNEANHVDVGSPLSKRSHKSVDLKTTKICR